MLQLLVAPSMINLEWALSLIAAPPEQSNLSKSISRLYDIRRGVFKWVFAMGSSINDVTPEREGGGKAKRWLGVTKGGTPNWNEVTSPQNVYTFCKILKLHISLMSIWKFLEKEAGKDLWNQYFQFWFTKITFLELFTKLGFF